MRFYTRTLLALSCCASLLGCATAQHSEELAKCEALQGRKLEAGTIEKAEVVHKNDAFMGFFKRVFLKIAAPQFPELKAEADFCRVTAKLHPEQGSEITADIWLPHNWNGKMFGGGGAGFNGGLSGASFTLNRPLKQGYAGVVTDAGHKESQSAEFAYHSHQQLIDYAYRANHVAAVFTKSLIANYYGKPVDKAYFNGCSNGGRDGLMLAHRYPHDYDGIIAGAPAAAYSELAVSFAWIQSVAATAPNLKDKLGLINDAVIDQCDALDGVSDGVLENPLLCPFEPAQLQCKEHDNENCLTSIEVAALEKLYDGPRLSDGTSIYPGLSVGGEALPANWDEWVVGNVPIAAELFRWMIYNNPDWDIEQFDIDKDYQNAKQQLSQLTDVHRPNLKQFFANNGKLILYHGWSDAGIPSEATIEIFDSIKSQEGAKADDHVKLFMVPGMTHCMGGVGPTTFDMFDHLVDWVENDNAPSRITTLESNPPAFLGLIPDGAEILRTRPLCPWPEIAQYKGSGSTDDESNFVCDLPAQGVAKE